MIAAPAMFRPRLAARRGRGRVFAALCVAATCVGFVVLIALLWRVAAEGSELLSLDFFRRAASQIAPETAGIKVALLGTLWLTAITAMVAAPIGIGAAIYLEEYAKPSRLNRFVQLNISNLAGVPSIVYGLLGLAVFVRGFQADVFGAKLGWSFGRSVLSGGLTLALLVLPVIIIATRESLLAVPKSTRLAAFALGATRWQTIWSHVLPAALPGIMTGLILSLSRAVGEAAPLILIGAVNYINFPPRHLSDQFTAMPIQIFQWSSAQQVEFHRLAAAAIIVLLLLLFIMNALAVGIRTWRQIHKIS